MRKAFNWIVNYTLWGWAKEILIRIAYKMLEGAGDRQWFGLCWGSVCLKSCHYLRNIESTIASWFVGVGMWTALKQILFNIQLIMKGRSNNITLWDLEVCLLRISAWLSLWNTTFLFFNLAPLRHTCITNTTGINYKDVMSKRMFDLSEPAGQEK